MRFLVVARPRDPIPPQQIPMLAEAAKQWFDQNQDRLVSFGNFAGGGVYKDLVRLVAVTIGQQPRGQQQVFEGDRVVPAAD